MVKITLVVLTLKQFYIRRKVCTYLIKCMLSVNVNEGSYMSRTLQYAM